MRIAGEGVGVSVLRPTSPRRGTGVLRCRRASSAVEFALIAPLLLTLLCGTFQYGILMFAYNAMESAARDATRQLSTGTASEADARTAAQTNLPPWVSTQLWNVVTRDVGSTGTDRVQTTISVPSDAVSILNLVPMPQTLSVKVVMQKES